MEAMRPSTLLSLHWNLEFGCVSLGVEVGRGGSRDQSNNAGRLLLEDFPLFFCGRVFNCSRRTFSRAFVRRKV